MKTKLKTISFLFVLALVLTCVMPFTTKAFAHDQSYESLKQTEQTKTSITIEWASYLEKSWADYSISNQELSVYEGYKNDDSTPILTVPMEDGETSYTIEELKPGMRYTVEYKADYTTASGYGSNLSVRSSVYTLPGKVKGVKQDKWWYWAENCDVVWEEQSGVDGYEYVVKNYKKKTIAKNPERYRANSCSFKIKNNTVYTIKVRAYTELNGKKHFGDWSETAYCFTQPMVAKASYNKKGKMTIKWNKVNGCDDYTVYVSTKEKKGYKKVKTVKASQTSLTLSKVDGKQVSSKNTYYFYIVGTKNVKGKKYTSGKHYTQQVRKGYVETKWTF